MARHGGKYGIGTLHSTNYSGDIRVLEVVDTDYRLIEFINTGNTDTVQRSAIRRGSVRDREAIGYTKSGRPTNESKNPLGGE